MKKFLLTALLFLAGNLSFAWQVPGHGRFAEDDIMTRTLEDWKTNYTLKAEFVPESLLIRGKAEIVYRNLSEDTLKAIYLDLGYPTYAPGHEPDLTSLVFEDILAGKLQALNHGFCRLDTLLYNVAPLLKNPEMAGDSSLMKIFLPTPLIPGGEGFFIVVFETRLGSAAAVPDFSSRTLTVDTWHPVIPVYEGGHWHFEKDTISGKRLNDYSVFRVSLKIDSAYSLIGSGHLLNEREHYGFLPKLSEDSLYIDLVKQQAELVPGVVYHPMFAKGYKEYYWRTRGVQGFSFVIGKNFSLDRTETDQTLITTAYSSVKSKLWQEEVIKTVNEIIADMTAILGRYPYRELTVVTGSDRADTEPPDNFIPVPAYINGREKLTVYLTLKIIESWFPRIAPGETVDDRFNPSLAALLTMDFLCRQEGGKGCRVYEKYARALLADNTNREVYDFNRYTLVSRPVDLQSLRYCLGEETFDKLLRDYMKNSRYRIVFENTFERLVEELESGRYTWFYDDYSQVPHAIDFQLGKTSFRPFPGGGLVEGEIIRYGDIPAPLEIGLVLSQTDTLFEIVESERFQNGRYTFSRPVPDRPIAVILDPRFRVRDKNRDNNYYFFRFTRARVRVPANLFPAFRLLED
ncbi:MAG: hypothetical protein ACOYVF_07215 [Candidatus Zixiibacteriota bacterium]